MVRKSKEPKPSDDIEFTIGSGNVYADLGFQNPVEMKAKADLAMLITRIIKGKKLTQQKAAELMGIDQPKVSKITRGILSEFTIERLMRFVLALGFDIELRLKPHMIKTSLPAIHVALNKTHLLHKQNL